MKTYYETNRARILVYQKAYNEGFRVRVKKDKKDDEDTEQNKLRKERSKKKRALKTSYFIQDYYDRYDILLTYFQAEKIMKKLKLEDDET